MAIMTHVISKIVVKTDAYTKSRGSVIDIIKDDMSFFSMYEVIYRKEFTAYDPGTKLEVVFRSNIDSKTPRRYFISCKPFIEEKDVTAEAIGSLSEDTVGEKQKDVEASEAESSKVDLCALIRPARSVSNNFFIEPKHIEAFDIVTSMHQKNPNESVKMLMVGKAGFGKTSLGREYANALGYEVFRQDCASVRDPEEWFGYREAKDGSTIFVKSPMMEVLEKGNCVVILDEFNRLESHLHNSIYHLLEPKAEPVIHGERFTLGENVLFIMTINVGYSHAGTFQLDAALISRADVICEVGPLPAHKERDVLVSTHSITSSDASTIVSVSSKIRSLNVIECSTRTSLQLARVVSAGATVRQAFEHVIVNRCLADISTMDSAKQVIDLINTSLGVYEVPKGLTGFGLPRR